MKRFVFLLATALLPYVASANSLKYAMAMGGINNEVVDFTTTYVGRTEYNARIFSGATNADPRAGAFTRTERSGEVNPDLGYLSAESAASFSPTVIPQVRSRPSVRETIRAYKAAKLSKGPSGVKKEKLSDRIYGLAGILFSIGLIMFVLFSDNNNWVFIPALMIAGIVLMILSVVISLIALVVSAIEWVGRIFKKKPKSEQVEASVE